VSAPGSAGGSLPNNPFHHQFQPNSRIDLRFHSRTAAPIRRPQQLEQRDEPADDFELQAGLLLTPPGTPPRHPN